MDQLPEELIEYIWRLYFSTHVLTCIKPLCKKPIFINTSGKSIPCNAPTNGSIHCEHCLYGDINYY